MDGARNNDPERGDPERQILRVSSHMWILVFNTFYIPFRILTVFSYKETTGEMRVFQGKGTRI